MKKYLIALLLTSVPIAGFCQYHVHYCTKFFINKELELLDKQGVIIHEVTCQNPEAILSEQIWTVVYED